VPPSTMRELFLALQRNRSVTSLNLSCTGFSNLALPDLCDLLKATSTLRKLYFEVGYSSPARERERERRYISISDADTHEPHTGQQARRSRHGIAGRRPRQELYDPDLEPQGIVHLRARFPANLLAHSCVRSHHGSGTTSNQRAPSRSPSRSATTPLSRSCTSMYGLARDHHSNGRAACCNAVRGTHAWHWCSRSEQLDRRHGSRRIAQVVLGPLELAHRERLRTCPHPL